MLLLFLIALILCIGITIYYLLGLRQRYKYFDQRGISTPPYEFFYGHLKTLWNSASYHRQLESWTKEYGKIYGIYEGAVPTLVVSDPNFLQEVFIKQFSFFPGRKPTFGDFRSQSLFSAVGEKWHRFRHVINPAFSSAKLKMMCPLINECVRDTMEKLADHARDGTEFNIFLYYKRMTMDVICRCAFGLDTDLQNNPNNIYFKKLEEIFGRNVRSSGFFKLAKLMPQLANIIAKVLFSIINTKTFINKHVMPWISKKQLNEFPVVWLLNRLREVVDERQKTATSRVDVLQLMLEALNEEKTNDEMQDSSKTNYWLTREEVVNNAFIFMLAGYQSTSTALAYATYELARHSKVLQKLQAEIDQLPFNDDDNFDEEMKKYSNYDVVARMPYMDMFISEVLRMYPISNSAIQRCASKDTVVQGIKIDKGNHQRIH
ncbi:unnamed protein product [Adineta steineri]|uniref:Cytochrome P450 n=1 Tax=Adineta steineri TaxID=433720 RepID=A0A814L1N9_9BILA|nr:unnamed protein product [Adineta steineri]CAF3966521.1 unnamed protein product [Adineta steineri]